MSELAGRSTLHTGPNPYLASLEGAKRVPAGFRCRAAESAVSCRVYRGKAGNDVKMSTRLWVN